MRIRYALLASAAVLSVTAAANAATFKGWYVGLEGGANWIDDTDAAYSLVVNNNVAQADTSEASFDTGWAVFATVGYAFAGNWRLEAEAGYRSNDVSARFQVSDSVRAFDGELDEFSLMANVLYDIPLGQRWRLSLGAGAGGDHVDIDAQTKLLAAPSWDPISGDDWRFAAQGIAGLSYALSPRWEATLTYRYLRVSPPSILDVDPISVGIVSVETIALDDLSKHSLTLGLRVDLAPDEAPVAAAPPPPPPPPSPPPPAVKQFIIFFGFDKCEITAEADRVLSEAASTAKSTGAASVKIVGHTDTSGSNAYNQRLSECRSGAAKSNLVGKGVPDGAISSSGRGETELMVQTGDAVREPQNRRATIDLN